MYKKHKANYHSHTYLCGHAEGKPIDYVKIAIEKKYDEIGISEHAPMSNLRNKNSRLDIKDYPTYLSLLEEAKLEAVSNKIKFYKGLEIEYFKHLDIYDNFLKDVDYLILGQHYIIENGKNQSTFDLTNIEQVRIYKDTVIEALKTGYFNLLCHPDLCFHNIKEPTDEMYDILEEIIDVAIEMDVPLELNANGIRKSLYRDNNTELDYYKFKYPRIKFFERVAKKNAKVIVSSDAHRFEDYDDWAIEEAYKLADKLKLNLIYKLDMNYYNKKQG